jgi:hypothetical protein
MGGDGRGGWSHRGAIVDYRCAAKNARPSRTVVGVVARGIAHAGHRTGSTSLHRGAAANHALHLYEHCHLLQGGLFQALTESRPPHKASAQPSWFVRGCSGPTKATDTRPGYRRC